jgi:myosin tail region-interacting protein MTI1
MVGAFPQAAEIRQPSAANEGERVVVAASSRPSTVHGQHATDDFGAAQAPGEPASLALALSADDISDDEMAPPRVTRPLPPDPPAPAPASGDLASAPARAPPPPIVPKRTSLPPPARVVPVPLTDSPPRVQSSSPHRAPIAKRASLAPPSREIPSPAPDSLDIASLRPQPSTRRISLPPPNRPAPSPSVSREGSLVPPPPPPPGLSYSERDSPESGQTTEAPRIQEEFIAPPLHVPTPTRKPTIPPPVPDGRRNVESRRSTDSRSSHEERRGSAQYATLIAPAISGPGPVSPPSKKRVPSPLPIEQEILDEDVGGALLPYYSSRLSTDATSDPIDPRFHAPPKSPGIIPQIPRSSSPMSGTDPVSSVPPATPPPLPSANESGRVNLPRRATIAERKAKLGGIKFGAPPPVNRVQPSGPTQSAEDAVTEGSAAGSGQPVPEEEEDEEDEQARRQRIAAKIAGMGGMRVGMLPTQPSIARVSTPPPPPIPEEEATPLSPRRDIVPPRQPAAYYHESEQEYEQPSSSDDGVQVEAEESELEEVGHEDLEDEYDNGGVEGETPVVPPPPPPRSTRPPIPTTRPPIPPSLQPGRSGSNSTITPVPRPLVRQSASDFVIVDPEEAPLPPPTLHSRVPSHQWSVHLSQESSDLAGSSQWELPSIPSGSLDLGTGDLSWSEDSTAYPPAVPSRSSISTPPPLTGGALQQLVGQRPRTPAAAVPSQMTSDDLRVLWSRVGADVGQAASGLLDRSKRTLVGNGSYEGFIAEALALVPNALPPQSPGEYGILIYAQTGAQVHTRVTDILPGDVVVLDAAKLKGIKGLHTYHIHAGEGAPCMGIVNEFDVKKLKLKALQANRRVGQAVRTCFVGWYCSFNAKCVFSSSFRLLNQ